MKTIILIAVMAVSAHATTVEDIAKKSKCDIGNIAYYVGQALQYPRWNNHAKDFEEAQVCLDRGGGDCKCHATVAMEVMGYCGYKALMITIRDDYQAHAMVIFKDKKGNRGYLNTPYYRIVDGDTPWGDIIKRAMGRDWRIVE